MDGKLAPARAEAARLDRFTATRWSLVAAASNSVSTGDNSALHQLCLHYWYPVYVYIRNSGQSPHAAQDLTHAFFGDLIGAWLSAYAPHPGNQFRDFLLSALQRFLARGGHGDNCSALLVPPFNVEFLEARHQADATAVATPALAYQRAYALALMSAALNRLRIEARQAGRSALFESLQPFLTVDAAPGQFEELAQRLQLRPMAIVMACKRLRQRFRELVEAELADTVGSAEALALEREALRRALGSSGVRP